MHSLRVLAGQPIFIKLAMTLPLRYPVRSFINLIGVVFSVAALAILVVGAAKEASVWHVVSFSIYGVSLVAMWTMSLLYHSLNVSKAANEILRQIDHAMIYFLIAGTYTPMCLVVLRGGWGWSLLGINWVLAIAGIVLKLVFKQPPKSVIAILFAFYIIMGWLVVVAWSPLVHTLPAGGVFWLISGGIFYTVGAMTLGIKRLNFSPKFGSHEIWHLFVLAGSFSHFWLMLKYILYINS